MNTPVRENREQQAEALADRARRRYAAEERLQLLALIVLAALVLAGTVLVTGLRNVFLPGWWRLG